MSPEPRLVDVPRIELHCHLDASMRRATIEDLARREGLRYETPIAERVVAPPDCDSLERLLASLDVQIDVLQQLAALERAAFELVEDWHDDRVVHGEVRFAPQLHQRNGLDLDAVVDAVDAGLRRGRRATGLSTSLIVCVLRHQPPSVGVQIAELAVRRRDVIAGIDLAGPEAGHPAREHVEAFTIAGRAGVPITIHAGEADGPDSVWAALELGATRIGHGVRSILDPALVRELADRAVTLECAPVCNVATRAVGSLEAHPIEELRRAGVPVTVNTDTRTPLATDLDRELAALTATFGWGIGEIRATQLAAAHAAFTDDATRRRLVQQVTAQADAPHVDTEQVDTGTTP